MESVPCPMEDKGICTIPDKTAVVEDGVFSIRSRSEIEESNPDLDLSSSSLRPLRTSFDPARLRETLEALDPGESDVAFAPDPEFATQLLEQAGAKTTVVVNCTCGHPYVLDI
jgi:hypothetical protein